MLFCSWIIACSIQKYFFKGTRPRSSASSLSLYASFSEPSSWLQRHIVPERTNKRYAKTKMVKRAHIILPGSAVKVQKLLPSLWNKLRTCRWTYLKTQIRADMCNTDITLKLPLLSRCTHMLRRGSFKVISGKEGCSHINSNVGSLFSRIKTIFAGKPITRPTDAETFFFWQNIYPAPHAFCLLYLYTPFHQLSAIPQSHSRPPQLIQKVFFVVTLNCDGMTLPSQTRKRVQIRT